MSFSLSISGQINGADAAEVEAKEQAIADAIRQVIADNAEHFTYAGGSFDYTGSINLLPADAPGGGTVPGGTDPTPTPDPSPAPTPDPAAPAEPGDVPESPAP